MGLFSKRNNISRAAEKVTPDRIMDILKELEVTYLTDKDGSVVSMWERYSMLIGVEGSSDDIFVARVRPYATVPPEWVERAYKTVNEWNLTRRFYKAFIGDVSESNQSAVYAEMQIPVAGGLNDDQLHDILGCAVTLADQFVEWLHGDGGLL